MSSIADPHPDWTAQLAARFEAAAQDASAWLALIGWLAKLALARICAFGAAPALLYGDLALRRDLRAMVRLAETMLRVAISEAAAAIAFYRVHPEQALPAWLRDGLGTSTPRPGAARHPQREKDSRLPSFRVSDGSSGPKAGAKRSSAHRASASSERRAAIGGTESGQAPQTPRTPEPRRRSAQRDDGEARTHSQRPGPSPARLTQRLLAILRAMPNVQKYAWRLAKARARRRLALRTVLEAPLAPQPHGGPLGDTLAPVRRPAGHEP